MYAQEEKSKENKSRAVGNSVAQKKSSGWHGVGIVDNRSGQAVCRTSRPIGPRVSSNEIRSYPSPPNSLNIINDESLRQLQRIVGVDTLQRYVSVNSNQIIQRNASTMQSWTDINYETGHQFEDNGSFITVNKNIDITEKYLVDMYTNKLNDYKNLLTATKALKDNTATETETGYIKEFHKSSGGRLRFREHMGPTSDSSSKLEKFIDDYIKSAYDDTVPLFVTNMDLYGRARLYDLANSGRKKTDHIESLKWAKARAAANVGELVNYAEYYISSQDYLERRIEKSALDKFDTDKSKIVVNESQVPRKAQEIANSERVKTKRRELETTYNPIIGKVFQNKLKEPDYVNIQTLTGVDHRHTDLSGKNRGLLKKEISDKIVETLTTLALTQVVIKDEHRVEARKKIRREMEEKLLETKRIEARGEETTALPTRFSDERGEARTKGYAGTTGPKADDNFWTLGFDTQVAKIKAAANSKIPFTSDHAAAYHALKHYSDISQTEDRAEKTTLSKNESYYDSATKTVKSPTETVEKNMVQLRDNPSFFFFRTVPKDSALRDSRDVKMRAIVVVSDSGHVALATYFRS